MQFFYTLLITLSSNSVLSGVYLPNCPLPPLFFSVLASLSLFLPGLPPISAPPPNFFYSPSIYSFSLPCISPIYLALSLPTPSLSYHPLCCFSLSLFTPVLASDCPSVFFSLLCVSVSPAVCLPLYNSLCRLPICVLSVSSLPLCLLVCLTLTLCLCLCLSLSPSVQAWPFLSASVCLDRSLCVWLARCLPH